MGYKPTSFKSGVPKAERNGFFGIEEEIIADAGDRIVAIVTYEVIRVMHEELEDEKYPVVEATHIEVLRDPESQVAVMALLQASHKARTSVGTLDLGDDTRGEIF